MKSKTKLVTFELEVEQTFNPYKFFQMFKRIQYKGFFKDVVRVSKLDTKGEIKEMQLSAKELEKQEQFILAEAYGVK